MDYKVPFKKTKTSKKETFLKTLQQMLATNEVTKKRKKTVLTGKKYIKINGKKRLVHVGKKGGRYYIKNKKKCYIPKNKKLIGGCGACMSGGGIDLSGSITAATLFMISKWLSEKNNIKRFSK
jgi:hypothetical protein|tara:strand:- start:2541 stop:2909 length:369 start_codon:yes stop_codon:yes gene_type:complete